MGYTFLKISDNACREYPCEHGGTCIVVSEDPGYKCECSEPWTGANCEREKSNCPVDDKCFNEGICYSTSSGFQCRYVRQVHVLPEYFPFAIYLPYKVILQIRKGCIP